MATYNKATYNIPAYQQGNVADFEFDLDSNFPIYEIADISFQVRKGQGVTKELIIPEKLLSGATITLTDRTVLITFSSEEMKLQYGSFYYEIDFINLDGDPFATIGGTFTIEKETNNQKVTE